MAGNFVQPGKTITMVAPYAVASGAGIQNGVVFGVALSAAAQGASVEVRRFGVFDLPKAIGQSWVADTTLLYWDNTAKNLTSTASSNKLVGVARQNQASGDTIGRALLSGQLA